MLQIQVLFKLGTCEEIDWSLKNERRWLDPQRAPGFQSEDWCIGSERKREKGELSV